MSENLDIIGSDNGLMPFSHPVVSPTKTESLAIGRFGKKSKGEFESRCKNKISKGNDSSCEEYKNVEVEYNAVVFM